MPSSTKPPHSRGRTSPAASRPRGGTATARERSAELRRARERAEKRSRLLFTGGLGLVGLIVVIALVVGVVTSSGSSSGGQVLPPPVTAGAPDVQPAALTVPDTSGIQGVVAYDTTGWPVNAKNGPAAQSLGHNHVPGPVTYSVTPPVGGDHNGTWMNCGIYDQPVPAERAVHNLEHGAIWITYQPSLPASEVSALRAFVHKQGDVTLTFQGQSADLKSNYMDLSPYPNLSSPIVMSSWGHQLALTSATDLRMQRFVDTFRVKPTYTPEYGSACSGGVGTPLS